MRLRWLGSKVDGAPEKVDARAGNYVQNLKNANFAHKEDTQMRSKVIYVQLKKKRRIVTVYLFCSFSTILIVNQQPVHLMIFAKDAIDEQKQV